MRVLLTLGLLVGCGPRDGSVDSGLIPGEPGDALIHQARSDTSTFWETTDVAAKGAAVYTCTGVDSLVVHDAKPASQIHVVGDLRFAPYSNLQFPRCSHVDVLGDRMVVSARRDEVQDEGFLALVDISDPLSPSKLADVGFGELAVEEAALQGNHAYLVSPESGLLRFDVSSDGLMEAGSLALEGTPMRVGRAPSGLAVGTTEGQVHLVDEDLNLTATVEVGGAAMGMEPLADGRLAVAVGSIGLVLVDVEAGTASAPVSTNGTALRLWSIDEQYLAVANWSDLRVYDVSGEVPVLWAVDAIFESEDKPRTFAVAATGDIVIGGTWTGIHALKWDPAMVGPELTLSSLEEGVPNDGAAYDVPIEVENEGQVPLEVTDVKARGNWSASPASFTLAPGETQTVTLSTTGATSVTQDEVTFKSNDPDEPKATVLLRTGADAVFEGDPALDFSYVALNNGTVHTLSEQRGKVVLLSYFATF